MKVKTSINGGVVLLTVTDSGRGFLPGDHDEMFEEFTADEQGATVGRGLGLGLSIAKRLAGLHRGSIRAESDGEGKGATFTLAIPSPTVRVEDGISKQRVLVIDDNPNIVGALEEYLLDAGHDVQIANSAEMALSLLDVFLPSVCLCDIGLPGADGFTLAREIRRRSPNVRLFSMSGFSDRGTMRDSQNAGFTKHYIKPILVEQFLEDLGGLPLDLNISGDLDG